MSDRFTIDGIEDLFREDILRFTERLRAHLEHLQKQPDDDDVAEETRAIGHSIRGTSSLVGLTYLSFAGGVLERLAEVAGTFGQANRHQARRIYAAMRGLVERIEDLLQLCLVGAAEQEQRSLYQEIRSAVPPDIRVYLPEDEELAEEPGSARVELERQSAAEQAKETEFADELAEIFAQELREYLQSVPAELSLLSASDTRAVASQQLNRIFHTIKGSAAMVGLGDVSEQARRLERLFSEPESISVQRLRQAQADLNALFARTDLRAPELSAALERAPELVEQERELLEAFNVDASEAIERCEQLLLALERQPSSRDVLQALFRQFHTLKGAAGAVGLSSVAGQLHHGESLLESVMEGGASVDGPRLVDFLFRLTDSVRALIDQALGVPGEARPVMSGIEEEIAALQITPQPVAPAEIEPLAAEPELPPVFAQEAEPGVVRVQANRLDALMNQVGQLVFSRTRMDQKIQTFSELRDKLYYCRARLAETIEGFQRRFEFTIGDSSAARSGGDGQRYEFAGDVSAPSPAASLAYGAGVDEFFTDLEFDKYDDFNILARSVIELATDTGEIADQLGQYIDALSEEARQFSKITTGLQRQITTLRLVPLDVVFRRLLRPVRDAARREGKLVKLDLQGGDVQLDRAVIEALYAPLLHLVRNAVTHGIEAPGVREARGKPRTGTVRIIASALHNSVVITVEDDGAGIDFNAILAKARALRLIDPRLPPRREQLLSLIFRPGFTTGTTVTDLSGRGVGMDVVMRQVAALNGSVLVDSKEGQGAVFRLSVPITTAIEEVLVLDAAGQLFALPIDFVERTVLIEEQELRDSAFGHPLAVLDEELPVLFLNRLVGGPLPAEHAVGVILRAGERAMVLITDRVVAQREVVRRPLSRLLGSHPFLSGGTVSGAGEVIFVLQVGRLFEMLGQTLEEAVSREPAPAELVVEKRPAPRGILVVDDSISVRKLAARFIESEGLEVETAVDGVDALEKIEKGSFRVVVTDLEMPRMHGYDLIAAIKSHPKWSHLPVIVVTSRSSEKHRLRAQEVGAEGYVTKPFSKEELLSAILKVTEWRPEGEPLHELGPSAPTDERGR
jgi:chemosensory pili system protein ChpA (sensor histidine kinase/response regulator)